MGFRRSYEVNVHYKLQPCCHRYILYQSESGLNISFTIPQRLWSVIELIVCVCVCVGWGGGGGNRNVEREVLKISHSVWCEQSPHNVSKIFSFYNIIMSHKMKLRLDKIGWYFLVLYCSRKFALKHTNSVTVRHKINENWN